MNDRVRELAELTGWTGRSYVEIPWDVVHEKLGFELPSDYRSLFDVFPPGTFYAPDTVADVIVQPPYRVDGVPDHLHQFEVEIEETEDWRREHPEDVPEDLVPWARADHPALFWVRRSPDPEQWTVAISNAGIWRCDDEPVVEEFDCGAVEFLIGFVSGRLRSRVLAPLDDDVETRALPLFRPIEEQEWLDMSEVSSPRVRRISLRRATEPVDVLADVIGWSGPVEWRPDWQVTERLLGLALPDDYKALLNVVPMGKYAGTVSLSPPTLNGHEDDLLARFREVMLSLTRGQEKPYAAYPALPGLIPWAEFDHPMAGTLFWLADKGDPNSWPVVAWGADGNWDEYDTGTVAFLTALVRGETSSDILMPKPGAPAYRTFQDLFGAPSNTG